MFFFGNNSVFVVRTKSKSEKSKLVVGEMYIPSGNWDDRLRYSVLALVFDL